MSNDPVTPQRGSRIRRTIYRCLLVLAIPWVGFIVWLMISSKELRIGDGTDFGYLFWSTVALDVLALIALGLWILEPPKLEVIDCGKYWAGRIMLFLVLGAAILIFFFTTCLFVAFPP